MLTRVQKQSKWFAFIRCAHKSKTETGTFLKVLLSVCAVLHTHRYAAKTQILDDPFRGL